MVYDDHLGCAQPGAGALVMALVTVAELARAGGGVGEQYAGKVKSKLLRSLNFKTFAQKRASISVTAKANGGKLYAASAIDTKHASRILSVFIFVYYKLCFPCSLCINLVWISYRF